MVSLVFRAQRANVNTVRIEIFVHRVFAYKFFVAFTAAVRSASVDVVCFLLHLLRDVFGDDLQAIC